MIKACGFQVEIYIILRVQKTNLKKDQYNVLFAAGGPFATGGLLC